MPVTIRLIPNRNWPHMTLYPGCSKDIAPYYSIKNGGVRYTGFDESNEDERKEIEQIIKTDLSPNSEFWDFFSVRLIDEDLILYPESNIQDRIKYIFLSKHNEGCHFENGIDITKTFMIVDEEKAAIETNKKAKLKRAIYRAVDDMTEEDVRDCLRLFGINTTGMSMNMCNQKLNEFVETQPNRINDLWIHNSQRSTYILFYRALHGNIITRNKGIYMYNAEVLGSTPEMSIGFLADDRNLETRQGIVLSLEGRPITKSIRKKTVGVDQTVED